MNKLDWAKNSVELYLKISVGDEIKVLFMIALFLGRDSGMI